MKLKMFRSHRNQGQRLPLRASSQIGPFLFSMLGLCVAFGSGCATRGSISSLHPAGLKLEPVTSSEPVMLRLKGELGEVESIQYLSRSVIRTFDGMKEVSSQTEDVRFRSQGEVVAVDEKAGRLTQALSVIAKEGNANLHDFAMPEIGERLLITSETDGRVVKAGDKPTSSIFYVPPISLPRQPVQVGDTWPLQARWITDDGVPFALEMVSILHGLYKCGVGLGVCADIEISGNVVMQTSALPRPIQALSFTSEWKGRLLFSLEQGTVLWSRVNSDERFVSDPARRDVNSCLEAVLVAPESLRLPGVSEPTCQAARTSSDATAL